MLGEFSNNSNLFSFDTSIICNANIRIQSTDNKISVTILGYFPNDLINLPKKYKKTNFLFANIFSAIYILFNRKLSKVLFLLKFI